MRRGNDESIVIRLVEKVFESARSVIPILGIVCLLSVSVAPLPAELLLRFFIGALFLILGMGLFSRGVEQSMTPIGNKIGTSLTRTKNLPLILIVSFLLGFAVTVAEPDLQVLARTVPHISNSVLLITVGIGVGLFLSVGMLRILTGTKFRYLLLACYGIIFVLSAFTDSNFLGIAFDAGGVTTGPMTVPFISASRPMRITVSWPTWTASHSSWARRPTRAPIPMNTRRTAWRTLCSGKRAARRTGRTSGPLPGVRGVPVGIWSALP